MKLLLNSLKYFSLLLLNLLLLVVLIFTDYPIEMIQMSVAPWFTIMDKALRYTKPELSEEVRNDQIRYFGKVSKRKINARNKNKHFVEYFETTYIKANKLATPENHKKYLKCKQNLKELNILVDEYETIFKECRYYASLYDKEN